MIPLYVGGLPLALTGTRPAGHAGMRSPSAATQPVSEADVWTTIPGVNCGARPGAAGELTRRRGSRWEM